MPVLALHALFSLYALDTTVSLDECIILQYHWTNASYYSITGRMHHTTVRITGRMHHTTVSLDECIILQYVSLDECIILQYHWTNPTAVH